MPIVLQPPRSRRAKIADGLKSLATFPAVTTFTVVNFSHEMSRHVKLTPNLGKKIARATLLVAGTVVIILGAPVVSFVVGYRGLPTRPNTHHLVREPHARILRSAVSVTPTVQSGFCPNWADNRAVVQSWFPNRPVLTTPQPRKKYAIEERPDEARLLKY